MYPLIGASGETTGSLHRMKREVRVDWVQSITISVGLSARALLAIVTAGDGSDNPNAF